jgi:hypothetical protein
VISSSLTLLRLQLLPGLIYNGSRSRLGFAFPQGNSFGNVNSYFGPNFQFTVPTPDSGLTVSLLGLALLGLAAVRRKLVAKAGFRKKLSSNRLPFGRVLPSHSDGGGSFRLLHFSRFWRGDFQSRKGAGDLSLNQLSRLTGNPTGPLRRNWTRST